MHRPHSIGVNRNSSKEKFIQRNSRVRKTIFNRDESSEMRFQSCCNANAEWGNTTAAKTAHNLVKCKTSEQSRAYLDTAHLRKGPTQRFNHPRQNTITTVKNCQMDNKKSAKTTSMSLIWVPSIMKVIQKFNQTEMIAYVGNVIRYTLIHNLEIIVTRLKSWG